MPECQFFSRNGFCTQSPDCLYLHIDPLSKIPLCPSYEKGFCKLGPECTKRHVRKVMCPRYLTGFCPLGPDCDMSHPKFVGITDSMRITLDPALRAIIAAKSAKSTAAAAAVTEAMKEQKPVENVTAIEMDEAQVPEESVLSNIKAETAVASR